MTPQLLISFQFLYDQPTTFWAMPIPRENTPDWVKMSESVLEKGPTLGSEIGPFFGSLVYLKCSKLEVYNPQVMILEFFSIISERNDPQIFHLQKKLWLYKLFMRLFSRVHPLWCHRAEGRPQCGQKKVSHWLTYTYPMYTYMRSNHLTSTSAVNASSLSRNNTILCVTARCMCCVLFCGLTTPFISIYKYSLKTLKTILVFSKKFMISELNETYLVLSWW